ncbi:MAG: NADH-quinone oxidoreductase subunit N, partial [Nitrospirae bacterium]|nr:NADH-quinone oxidoreductase subunit N [Nitrospirota bacterium]
MIWVQTYLVPLAPELIVLVTACVVLLTDLWLPKGRKGFLVPMALIGLALAAWATIRLGDGTQIGLGGMFVLDPFAAFLKCIFYGSTALAILLGIRYLAVEKIRPGEYHALLLFSTLGMQFMASAADLLMVYLGLELMSLSLYVLVGLLRRDPRSNEAALKYFVLGSVASAFLLYGIALLYGLTGTTGIQAVGTFLAGADLGTPALYLALLLLTVGFGFKIAAVPFHMWAPDAYEGAPTSVTAFMSVGPKVAGFAVLVRVFLEALPGLQADWTEILIVLAALTMVVGNVAALVQSNIKRMMGYSSIAHASYALIGLAVGDRLGITSVLVYLAVYAFMNLGAFGVILILRKGETMREGIEDFAGLAKTHPVHAFLMLLFMFSLTGIPPTAGFIGKFYLFLAAVRADLIWLVVLGV